MATKTLYEKRHAAIASATGRGKPKATAKPKAKPKSKAKTSGQTIAQMAKADKAGKAKRASNVKSEIAKAKARMAQRKKTKKS
jgi:hypothetical protein